jgi:hypothetical protein
MRGTALILIATLLSPIAGCGNSESGGPAKASPNGSTLIALPGDRGYFEIKTEIEPAPRGARGASRSSKIVLSFYQTDGTTPLSPVPAEVSVKIGSDEAGKTITLNPNLDKSKSKSPFQFTTSPGDYPEALRGTLIATVNGERIEAPFMAR